MEVTLENGFECKIKKEALDDWELIENLREVDKGNVSAMVDVVPQLLGNEQAKALKDYLRDKNGRVSIEKMTGAVAEILGALNQGKKS